MEYEALQQLIQYLLYLHKSTTCFHKRCEYCPYFSLNNGKNICCSELKDSERLEIVCREAEKMTFEKEGEKHDL